MGVRQTLSNLGWGFGMPLSLALPPLAPGAATVMGAMLVRIYRRQRACGRDPRQAWLYAAACLGGKVPRALGALTFAWRRLAGGPRRLIEYK